MFIALWVLILLQTFLPSFFNPTEIPYSEFKESVAAGKVTEVAVSPQIIHGKLKEDKVFHTIRIEDPDLLRNLAEHQVKVTGVIESTLFRDVLSWIVPIGLLSRANCSADTPRAVIRALRFAWAVRLPMTPI